MHKGTRSWPFRIGVLVLAGVVLYATAYLLMPPTADGLSVTVRRCATVQLEEVHECMGTTMFQKTYTDQATILAIRATLDGMHYQPPLLFWSARRAGDSF